MHFCVQNVHLESLDIVTTSPCEGNTCQNSATCVADATKTVGYKCNCAAGFTGDKCESKLSYETRIK